MLRLGRSQRPHWRRQGEIGGLNRPLQASDVPLGRTLVCKSHPRGVCPCKPTLAKGCMGTVHTTTVGYPRHPGCKACMGSCWTQCICLIGGRGRSGSLRRIVVPSNLIPDVPEEPTLTLPPHPHATFPRPG